MGTEELDLDRSALWRTIVESLPAAVLLVARDRRVVALNRWAEKSFGDGQIAVEGRGPGDILHCINAALSRDGCGHTPACADCQLNRATGSALAGGTLSQQEVRVTTSAGTETAERYFLLSASPVHDQQRGLAVLMLQEVTDVHRLRGLIPICASCKKIRRDNQAWEALELFIENHSHAQFTHGLCPECLERLYPEFATKQKPDPSRRT